MRFLPHLLANNRAWAARIAKEQPDLFARLAAQQAPQYLWIGCSDSRVPANQIVDLLPGELFVHRNVANLVVEGDLNCLSVLQFAVEVLHVRHVIVCGHYGCGGVRAALEDTHLGLIDGWLCHVKDIRRKHSALLADLADQRQRENRLSELNVIEQVRHVCQTSIVQDAWTRGQPLDVHGWIYGVNNGLLRDLNVTVASREEIEPAAEAAVAGLRETAAAVRD
ncbi:MAG TPA: carbonate dehydratase [Thermoanaerobaculia bacterium]|jgi:carbonic anhydrase|nr:carbonate dehydratase [Thermoanaerobaculia bacterium]